MIDNFTPSQRKAYDLLSGECNIFLTGEAGSGKSYVIRHFIASKNPKTFPILASTGAAAVLVGGRTFHSFMGLGIMEGGIEDTIERALSDRKVVRRLKKIDGFVLDEVSMIGGATLEAAESICRLAREIDQPWGGMRVIAVGDFAQLPPVERSGRKSWAFLHPVWKETRFIPVLLERNMRTENEDFLKVLNSVRQGEVSEEVESYLNNKVVEPSEEFEGTRLFPRRFQTDAFNDRELAKLEGEEVVVPSIYSGRESSIRALKKNAPLPEVLRLKVGCLVMLRQNDPKQRWVNGSTGWVESISKEVIQVRLLNGKRVNVEPVSFSLLNAEGTPQATVTNFPLSLAYATTIHKAQGMTLDKLKVDLRNLWEPGQAYVALSRVANPDELYLEGWQTKSIKCDPIVTRFYQYIKEYQDGESLR